MSGASALRPSSRHLLLTLFAPICLAPGPSEAAAPASLPAAAAAPVSTSATATAAVSTPDMPLGRRTAVQALLEAGPSAAIRRAFARLDLDGDGRLSIAELTPVRAVPGPGRADAAADPDGNGTIEPAEFQASFLTRNTRQPPDRTLLAERYLSEGHRLTELGYVKDALRSCGRAAAEYPEYAATWSALGLAQEAAGQLEQALASYAHALAIDPADASSLLRSSVLEYRLGRASRSLGLETLGLEMLARRNLLMGNGRRSEKELKHCESEILRMSTYYTDRAGEPARSIALAGWFAKRIGPSSKLRQAELWALALSGKQREALDGVEAELATSREPHKLMALKGRILARVSDFRAAVPVLRRALTTNPRGDTSWETSVDLFQSLARGGYATEARGMVEDLLARANAPLRRERLAQVLADSGFAERAAQLYEKNPELKGAARVELLLEQQRPELAKKLARREPSAESSLRLGHLLCNSRGPGKETLDWLDEACRRFPSNLELTLLRVHCLESLKRQEQAKEAAFQGLVMHPGEPQLRLALARLYLDTGATGIARQQLDEARRLGASQVSVDCLEVPLLLDENARDRALARLQALLPQLLEPRAIEDLGMRLLGRSEWQLARPLLEQAATRSDCQPETLSALATATLGMGNLRDGRRHLERLLRTRPKDTALALQLIGVLTELDESKPAIALLRDVLAREPARLDSWLLLAELLGTTGDRAGQKTALGRALALARASKDREGEQLTRIKMAEAAMGEVVSDGAGRATTGSR